MVRRGEPEGTTVFSFGSALRKVGVTVVLLGLALLGSPEARANPCDADNDGFESVSCGGQDCDDGDFAVNPGASERCDAVDNDCDGEVDGPTSVDATSWYIDADADGYGHYATEVRSCDSVDGYVDNDGDCVDDDATIYPGAPEVIGDNIDQNCVPGDDFCDYDGDGFSGCGYGDCDDSDPDIHPLARERCDGIDNDCDGDVDESDSADASPWFLDADEDGYGDPLVEVSACGPVEGHVANDDDCDDSDAGVHPSATEIPDDGIDQDCDPDNDSCDADEDGFAQLNCGGTDCDDHTPEVNPGAVELWYDGVDQDCDGGSDFDQDRDGQESADYGGSDCDDEDPTVYLGAPERQDGIDNDCDGHVEDSDQDGLTDLVELELGTDPNRADSDGDGLSDGVEVEDVERPRDTDADGVIDALDADDDNDGIPTVDERREDTDQDGAENSVDADDDGDGIDTVLETDVDTDGDGEPNYLDLDSDNDSISDAREGVGDADCDDVPDFIDAVDDGLCDGDDAVKAGCGCATPAPSPGWMWLVVGIGVVWRRRTRA